MMDKERQIISILTWGVAKYVFEKTGKDSFSAADLQKIYTVTKSDVYNYIEMNGVPEGAYHSRPSLKDGMYLIETPNGYEVYYQERGCKLDSKFFNDKKKAMKYLIDDKIYHSSVQLK